MLWVGSFFKLNLLDIAKQTPYIVISLDKSHNNVISRGQMDVLVRFWDSSVNKVSTRYVNSGFLGKSSAVDVLQKFEDASFELPKQKCIQISSDGPNVNLKFLDLLNEKRRDECLNELISIGTCGLRTVSRAFQNAENSKDWNIKKVLSAMHKIFHECPSKRADYEKVSLATEEDYPLLFCVTRWVENQLVAKKAQSIWPKIVAVLDFWSTLPKSKKPDGGDPKANKSYHVL